MTPRLDQSDFVRAADRARAWFLRRVRTTVWGRWTSVDDLFAAYEAEVPGPRWTKASFAAWIASAANPEGRPDIARRNARTGEVLLKGIALRSEAA
jgi:hypothetical protein